MILPHTRRLSRVSCKKWVRSQHFPHKNFLRWILIHSHKLFRKDHITSAETLYYQNIIFICISLLYSAIEQSWNKIITWYIFSNFANTILWFIRCKIHHYVAGQLLHILGLTNVPLVQEAESLAYVEQRTYWKYK